MRRATDYEVRMSIRNEPVEIEGCKATRETDKALLVEVEETGEEYWIPKSQIQDDSEVYEKGHEGKLVLPRWLAKEKGLADD